MKERRVDRILGVLEQQEGRAKVATIRAELARQERVAEISGTAIYIAVKGENQRLVDSGARPRFRTYEQGEKWGWISLESKSSFQPRSAAADIEARIHDANREIDSQIRERLRQMDWRTFESTMLTAVLEKLGFEDVEITQATRDGGLDARVSYKRALVEAKAVVSAKHWTNKMKVGPDEVRKMRGIKGDEDTALIVTTSEFSDEAKREARPGQNQRAVYLIDGDALVDICKRYELGVKKVHLPEILVIDERFLQAEQDLKPDVPDGSLQKFRKNMLDELTAEEIADLTGLTKGTVSTYKSIPERRSALWQRIREDDDLRQRALEIVARRRLQGSKAS